MHADNGNQLMYARQVLEVRIQDQDCVNIQKCTNSLGISRYGLKRYLRFSYVRGGVVCHKLVSASSFESTKDVHLYILPV